MRSRGLQPISGSPADTHSSEYHLQIQQRRGPGQALQSGGLGVLLYKAANPTTEHVAAKICALEGALRQCSHPPGQAAALMAIFNICSCGDHVVSSSNIYGGTFNLFAVTMKRMGIEFTSYRRTAATRSLRPPSGKTPRRFSGDYCQPHLQFWISSDLQRPPTTTGCPDSGQHLCNARQLPSFGVGADIVIHSSSKYMDGHAAALGGAIVDGGKFDWMAHASKFPA